MRIILLVIMNLCWGNHLAEASMVAKSFDTKAHTAMDISTSLKSVEVESINNMANVKHKIGIIVGSTRPNRIGHQIAIWVLEQAQNNEDLNFEIIDLAVWNLPVFDEPNVPSSGNYVHAHTKAWSQHIQNFDGFIFLTPEYNGGYPASLKNAIDYLCKEWGGKPAVIISYAYSGGLHTATSLKHVLEILKMPVIEFMPAIKLNKSMMTADGMLKNPAEAFAIYNSDIVKAVNELAQLFNVK